MGFARFWLPPLVWMALIWGFSTDLGSAEHTAGLFTWLVSRLFPSATPAQLAFAHGLLRKLGHVTEYAILAVLWFRALHVSRRLNSAHSAWIALAISVAWSILDELHQAFVPSRTAHALDILLDTTGAALATLLAHALSSRQSRRHQPHDTAID